MMRTYRPMRLAPYDLSPMLRSDLQGVDTWLRQLSTYMARVPVLPQGQPTALTPVAVTGNDGSTSLDDYLFLPGRKKRQIGYGTSLTVGGADSAFVDQMILAGNKISQNDATYAPGTIRLGIQGTVDVTSYLAVSPSVDFDTFPSQPFVVASNADPVNGDYVQIVSTGNADFDKNESTSTFPGFTFRISNTTVGRPAEDILLIRNSTGATNKHINLTDNVGTSYGYMQGSDWLTTGRMVIGSGGFVAERLIDLTHSNTTNGFVNTVNELITLSSSLTGAAFASYAGIAVTIQDQNAFTSGNYSTAGISLTVNGAPPAGVTLSSVSGFNGLAQGASGAGTVSNLVGGIWTAQGGSSGGLPTITNLIGLQIKHGQRTSTVTTAKGISLENPGGSTGGAVTDFIGVDYATLYGSGASVTNWHGIRHLAGPTTGSTNQLWFLDLQSSRSGLSNRILYKTALGWTPANNGAVTAMLHLGAGTTALAPLQFTTGTSLTSALAGAMEFTTDDLFFTITTGTARKRVMFADASGGLTSGRVPYATTNGRLTDIVNFEFNGTDLKIPNFIGVGAKTPSHFVDIPAGTTTVAPIRLTSGTDLTSATDGCVEYDGTDKKFTIGTSRYAHAFKNRAETITATKTFTTDPVLANTNSLRGTDSTSTVRTILTCLNTDIIRFAPLNSANGWTWTDTAGTVRLQLTALGGTPLFTFNDPFNFVFGTTTGTKIGTATSQKIGFWNAAPIVQPTTGIAAATFVANTSGTLNDSATWDGYTIGQVVKALRNLGVLA